MQYITVAQTAKLLAVSERTVRRMIKRGELQFRRAGRLIRIPANQLEEQECTTIIPLRRSV